MGQDEIAVTRDRGGVRVAEDTSKRGGESDTTEGSGSRALDKGTSDIRLELSGHVEALRYVVGTIGVCAQALHSSPPSRRAGRRLQHQIQDVLLLQLLASRVPFARRGPVLTISWARLRHYLEGSFGSPRYFQGQHMDRVAILVDAGYLFAAGSALLSGEKQRREIIACDERATVETLRETSRNLSDLPLLRIYWYDGTFRRNGPTLEHRRLARCNDVKVRLGLLNAQRQQKGVDSLIVTDLVELARNRAVSDVVLMSGDEDVRIGVQLAQGFGVRVHLLGIKPSVKTQSEELRLEADTCTEWNMEVVSRLMSLRSSRTWSDVQQSAVTHRTQEHGSRRDSADRNEDTFPGDEDRLDSVVRDLVDSLSAPTLAEVLAHMERNHRDLPYSVDGKLLARCRRVLGRDLTPAERRQVRRKARKHLKDKSTGDPH